MERVLNQAMYAIPNINQPVEVIVSAACVKKGKMPLIRKQMPDTVSA
jgi:ATP-dependent protease Clp ATPase subunit